MKQRTILPAALLLTVGAGSLAAPPVPLTPIEQLGALLFNDKQLSVNSNQSCAACHAPRSGWTGPKPLINEHGAVYEGSINGRFGNRKPPSSAYATPSPILELVDPTTSSFVGGNFWDGRATGEKLGNPAADQAQGPFLNPVEQGLPDAACVVYQACTSGRYGSLFQQVWGPGACDIAWPRKQEMKALCSSENVTVEVDRTKVNEAYNDVALSIAAYEDSTDVNRYSSKYDAYLAGQVQLTAQEAEGLALFQGQGNCVNCHVLDLQANGKPALLTDYTYDNLGGPKNPENPWYTQTAFNPDGYKWVDKGLGGFLASTPVLNPDGSILAPDYRAYAAANLGKQKVPTLRNVDLRPGPGFVKPYSHNGWFKSLKSIVHFYNTRDVLPQCPPRPDALPPNTYTEAEALQLGCWPEPEVDANINTTELGSLGLTDAQEDAIVAFMKTLSDGYVLPKGSGQGRR
jgi:cytochrome c peroxidase